MTKKNPWILGLSLVALFLAPALPALAASESKAKTSEAKASDSKSASKTEEAKPSEVKADKAEKAEDKAGSKDDTKPKVHHKSPVLAGFLGLIPGVAIHGTGHLYAGSWMKGLGLLAVEGAAIGVAAAQIGTIQADVDAISKSNNGGVPTDLSVPYTKVGILTVCGAAFLWSWFDDMAGAPIAAKEYNKIQDQGATASLQFAPRGDGAQFALATQF